MSMTREQVQAYLEVCKKATPGPWEHDLTVFNIRLEDGRFIAESRTIALQIAEALVQAWEHMEH